MVTGNVDDRLSVERGGGRLAKLGRKGCFALMLALVLRMAMARAMAMAMAMATMRGD